MNLHVHLEALIAMPRYTTSAGNPPRSRSEAHTGEHALQFAWIDWLISRTAKNDTKLAEEAGLPKNYLYRKRADGSLIQPTQIRLIADAQKLPGPSTYLDPGLSGLSDEGAPFDTKKASNRTAAAVAAILDGRPNAAGWTLRTRALEGAGFMLGDIIVTDSGATPMAGDAVVAQVYDFRTAGAETVFRLYEPPYLVAASDEPGLRKPLLVDNERVVVVGPITEVFRATRHS